MYPYERKLEIEIWIWYGVVFTSLLCRYWALYLRRRNWRSFYADDVLILFGFCFYTVFIVYVHGLSKVNPDHQDSTSSDSLKAARLAGIDDLVIEVCHITLLWGIKACILILCYRLTHYFTHQKVVIAATLYCILTYIATMILIFYGFCHPFQNNFVPKPSDGQCYTWIDYSIVQMVFNVSSDLLIIGIPISVVWTSRMDYIQKLGVCAVFGLSIFVVLAACLTKYYIFSSANVDIWVVWYVREGSMAVIVANLALCRPLLMYIYGKSSSILRTWKGHSSRTSIAQMSNSENNTIENSVSASHEATKRMEMSEVV